MYITTNLYETFLPKFDSVIKLVCFFRELFDDFPSLEQISGNNKFHHGQPLLFRSIITVKIKLGDYSFQKKEEKENTKLCMTMIKHIYFFK